MKPRRFLVLQGAVILAMGAFVFSPVFRGGWLTDWDDGLEITGNRDLRDWRGLWNLWFDPHTPDYFPLKSTAQWVQWHLWHADPAGYHLTNIGLHLLSALLLWRLLDKLGVRLAWIGGLIFAVHPLTVESVAWIAELKNVLSLPLVLGAVMAWVDWDRAKHEMLAHSATKTPIVVAERASVSEHVPMSKRNACAFRYGICLALFLAAMLCKSSVVMFPFVLLLYAWWKRGRLAWADLKATVPFFAVSLVLGIVTLVFQSHRAIVGEAVISPEWQQRVIVAGLAVAFYLWKSVLPSGLLPVYPRWSVSPPSLFQLSICLLVAAGLCWLAWAFCRQERRESQPGRGWQRHVVFGAGFFFINLIPVLGFVPMSFLRLAWVADHFVYLPLVGLVGLAAAGISKWRDDLRVVRIDQAGRHGGRPSIFDFLILFSIAALALESHDYAAAFANSEALWTHTLRGNPQAWVAENNLGNVLFDQGRIAEGASHYERALALKPDYPEAHNNLGNVFAGAHRLPEAIAQYEQALQAHPDYANAENGLANSLDGLGRPLEAIEHLQRAIKDNPGYAEAHDSLGNVLMELGRFPEAEEQFRETLQLKPDYPQGWNNLGNLFYRTGRTPDAIGEYEEALRLKPDFPEAHNNLGLALGGLGRLQDGAAQIEEAIRLKPDYADAHFNLGLVLALMKRNPEAIRQFELALQLKPDFPGARAHLEALQKK